ncbi:hypothetical protein [Paenibacillus sp. NPDC057967]|uniref:hypothetical protein n=1 Tax=Paenibacillus sp. NPDC057967 TaxID=3346293 RepID=UPI0036DEB8C6
MAQAAVKLGVSQRVLETEYYLVDLPLILRYKSQSIAEDRLMALSIATVSQTTDKETYERFAAGLRSDFADSNEKQTNDDEFDRTAFERLRGRVGRK